ncbi:carboxymuconolactone decarboxylase family protein [Polymorphospora rubra]|uniref:carboxymuconolactone decarboxylase family protein n=1 Tax=Polymorphospora rubra TaxID=338584 RepID=UPI0033FBBF61
MAKKLLVPVLGTLGFTQIRHVAPVRRGAARGLVAEVYRQLERDFGVLAPPVALHAPAPEVLAACWLMLRETVIVESTVDRLTKETVAAAVSRANTCPYCITVHEEMSQTLGRPARPPGAAPAGAKPVPGGSAGHPRAVADWVTAVPDRVAAGGRDRPFPSSHTPEVVGGAVLMHYLNRVVNVLLYDIPLPPGVPRMALGPVMKVLGRQIVGQARGSHAPGRSLDLLPAAEPPADLWWTATNPNVAAAFGAAVAAVEAAGARSVPAPVRELVLRELDAWDGTARPLDPSWLSGPVSGLAAADRPAGRLAMLVAFAAYRVDQPTVDAFRRTGATDADLVGLCAWAALAASRQIGARLAGPRDGAESPGEPAHY